ncbi:alanyl-tRNA synthetase [Dyadobacter sp. BE34]|uniref:Alanine--tRNA ligase n=1 Tax=Dyadobacter fermentans TaxID=94254 RepID=A0ABU1R728_9BACT|nr:MULTISPECIES: alanine--tRNA ligase [Dyadobacter]MDR6809012.1 alanyl-tRNA synthetase [Dyadobacter fermentans]MDR7046755.1 alanyl-tRNA synthetase [Dyadobacter sp. BE242]MDR7201069.1 alanyl-tRNA synthetase [Dyadobacter sp. BE34]MDR7219029.1 alanyl-tRNA synthetase [Dyadobacter sp. BE31]MDR7264761.1 alanyl-tRNA synthetase [Dyadobacter sp. BE32]
MTSHQIRQAFLDFFRSKEHLIVPSAPLVAKNDPTLMFNNSGMAQFKDFFLGNGTPPSRRIADTQKCLRVSGKHNDLEDVGFDTYHHTMFEMLGNWSFGDYFKKEAINWAWELLTEVYKLPKDRLYVSVFEGNEADGVPFDQEAWDLWKGIVGGDRIILGNKKDNFWEMGDTGPCGPCSEIHIDLRSPAEVAEVSGKSLVNNDHPQVVEIWNLVFMQFERKADGSLIPLPSTHVDTGMGFERLCMAIQQKTSNYDTDVFQNTIGVLETLSGKKYGQNGEPFADIAMRVISDHIRAVSFAITDGQLPSNVKAGYVIRRILRRAVRYGYSYLGFQEPFFHKLVPVLAEQFKDVFTELKDQEEFVTRVILEEEKSFLRTLESGLKRLDSIISGLKETGLNTIPGDEVFELSDTFGFPVDLTALIAREKNFQIDEAGYQDALAEQKKRSRQDAAKEATDWIELRESDGVEFLGYDFEETHSHIVKYRKVKTKAGEEYHIVLDRTPFYAEMGGQVGDTGELILNSERKEEGGRRIAIADTKKENDLFVHISRDKNLDEALSGAGIITAKIDIDRRNKIKANHTATHLMLSSMREVLGTHVSQKGSFLNDEVLRFDFAHFSKVTDEELRKIEDRVNEKIRENIALEERRNVPIQQALDAGATATFGEKYGDFVRLIIFDPKFSFELCGGTHVPSTGEIGVFKFISEGSVSAGVRRVEAVTGEKALELMRQQEETLNKIKDLLKGPTDLIKAVESLIEERSTLQKKIAALENEKIQALKTTLVENMETHSTFNLIVQKVDVPSADSLKQLSYELRDQVENLIAVFGAEIGGKPQLSVFIAENIVQETGLNAGKIVKDLAKEIRGGGGGQPFFATAGGSDASGLDIALEKAKGLF